MSLNIVKNATCTFCGCVCDDIELHAEGDRIVKAANACSLGDAWFKNHTAERLFPDALIDGKPATVDAAVEDRKSTRLNSSHLVISYAVFCLKKKKKQREDLPHPTPHETPHPSSR